MAGYDFKRIEAQWQERWDRDNVYGVSDDMSRPKYYVLDMFPYPSGTGLHIGHPEGYTATDIISRYKRMCGFNVLHPMGFDAFGLPTERQAMVENIHPAIITERNIATFTRQLKAIGFDYDWSRSVNTTSEDYVRWTQWMFLRIYNAWYDTSAQRARDISELPIPADITDPHDVELYRDAHRLAYIANIPVNWCEALGTVLANEEVDEWKEKGYTVERRPMRQWMLRITAYADRLLADLDTLQWPSSTLDMQRHWIGKSEGAQVHFGVDGTTHTVTVFTTRPDTLFGATYLVLAPEHPLVDHIVSESHRADVASYREAAALKSDLERTELSKVKTGVFTGAYAVNPATGTPVPVWVADYVLAHYGTGAIMAVPGHDERDHEFARTFGLPIVQVVAPANGEAFDVHAAAFVDDGVGMHSANAEVSIDGLPTDEAKRTIINWLTTSGNGTSRIQFKLRDWLFSRQRYWGEPIPIMYFEDGTRRALDADELPLRLPEVAEFKPAGTGESPLATVPEWVDFVDAKTGKRAKLETNTMPQWAGSCWYYLRYADPYNTDAFCSTERERYWLGQTGVDLYVGGGEHAVLHLLYARFWHKVMYDFGYVSSTEPFRRLFHQGLILGEDGRKMSKSLGNTINPDHVIRDHGADALRLFEMFLGPLEASKPWNTKGIEGITRFLQRVWRLIVDENDELSPLVKDAPCTPDQAFVLHSTIKKTREDIENLSFNTAIAQFMIFVNEFTSATVRPRVAMESFVLCLAPFAPHLAEELWMRLGKTTSVVLEAFPTVDETALVKSEVEIVVQVNSKVRGKVVVPAGADQAALEAAAQTDENVRRHLDGKQIRKTIVVPDKLVNFIVG
ncbi:MAG: leucine--tRNA ligase [Candidatus Kapabacteria bacterium]|nr:leucine--tRNA ligase [Candidatus Kapabacteria bacterium]